MAGKKMVVDFECFKRDEEAYKSLKEATQKLTNATETQFEEIKREKWYNRVFDMVTYSKKNEKRIAEQISSLAEAQQILIEILLRLSEEDTKVARMVSECMNDIKKLSEQDVFLFKKIRNLENIMLGIKVSFDIAELSNTNKIVLSGCLYHLAEYYGNSSEEQKRYANIVLEYIGTDATVDNLSYAIEKMENEDRKKVLTCCIEYMFLANGKMEIPDTLQDFIDEFDFGNKTISEIKEQTMNMYNLRGIDGFYGKYNSESYSTIENEFEFEFADSQIESEIVEIEITDMQHIRMGEEKEFRNNEIHLKTNINCEGALKFEHCILYYNETSDGNKIVLDEGASLIVANSVIFCKGYNATSFIIGEYNVAAKFIQCNFIDCSNFLKIEGARQIIMQNCKMYNCFCGFVDCDLACEQVGCNIRDNIIIVDGEMQQFNLEGAGKKKSHAPFRSMFCIKDYSEETGTHHFNISNNIVDENEKFRNKEYSDRWSTTTWHLGEDTDENIIKFFEVSEGGIISNCTFKGAVSCVEAAGVEKCNFIECREVIESYKSQGKIIDCVFEKCTDVVNVCNGHIVKDCQFIDCYNTLIMADGCGIEYCDFKSISSNAMKKYDENACVAFSGNTNYLKDCTFNGIDLENMFLIAPSSSAETNSIVATLERCNFKNCFIKGNTENLIQEYIKYDGFFKKSQQIQAIRISECIGLDKVNQETERKNDVQSKEDATKKAVGACTLDSYGVTWNWMEHCDAMEFEDGSIFQFKGTIFEGFSRALHDKQT